MYNQNVKCKKMYNVKKNVKWKMYSFWEKKKNVK